MHWVFPRWETSVLHICSTLTVFRSSSASNTFWLKPVQSENWDLHNSETSAQLRQTLVHPKDFDGLDETINANVGCCSLNANTLESNGRMTHTHRGKVLAACGRGAADLWSGWISADFSLPQQKPPEISRPLGCCVCSLLTAEQRTSQATSPLATGCEVQ